jgi:Flp pilus assembly CpaE family ATPase
MAIETGSVSFLECRRSASKVLSKAADVNSRNLGEMLARPEIGARTEWKMLVICPDPALAGRVRGALAQRQVSASFLDQYPGPGTVAAVAVRQGCNVCLVDVVSKPEAGLELISELALVTPVIALNTQNDADLILRCLRQGASEFLSDATADQVGSVLERLARLRGPLEPQHSCTVYAVMPGKPGCGASTLAAYLAIELRRSGVERVLLVDTDFAAGSITFLLKLKAAFHLGDAVRDCERMDHELWSRLAVSCHGVDVLPAPENAAVPMHIDHRAAEQLTSFWRGRYEAVILDLAGPHAAGFEFALLADQLLLVTTNELAALHETRRAIECLDEYSLDRARLRLLVTRYTPAKGLKCEAVETALKLKPYALLSNDYDAVQAAVLDAKPITPSSHLGRSVHELAQRLLGKTPPTRKRTRLFGLLAARD